ncbi:MAG TPA: undecaprenyl-diphosphate phosphatase [Ktedonobacteraceae bacterium]|nr:undecaprenyl-diphosphate phosphatase [Ktedonobacteraceae bacterium]
MNLNIWQTIFLALLQGVTELFPISSLGHTVIIPGLLNWGDLVRNDRFLPLIVALHLGTAIALVIYFWRDWFQVLRSIGKSIKDGEVKKGTEEWVSFLIIIGCIPAGLLGVFLEKPLKLLFASPLIASTFLVVNGSVLFLGERMRQRAEAKELNAANLDPKRREAQFRPLSSLTWKEAIVVGFAQSLALIPGISRSGTTMVAGLGVRLNHEDAARFSFLLGTPIIGAAALLEVPQLIGQTTSVLLLVGMGMVLAGVAAYLSTKFLMKYFETGRLTPFAYYCWGAGLITLIIFLAVLHTGA